MMDLFQDKPLQFEKLGMEARLSEDSSEWPQQLLDQLYQQAPFTSDYMPKVVLQEVDQDRRYAMGHIELINKLAINPRDDATPTEMRGKQKCLVPVVIQDGRLKPLDLLICGGRVEPLTEERLRRALFRPNLFDAIRKRPGDMSLIEQLYPPHRQFGGARGPMMADAGAGGTTKTGSAKPEFVMDAILPTIKQAHVSELEGQLNGDPSLRVALLQNAAAFPFLQKIAEAHQNGEQGGFDYMRKIAHSIKPTVIQIQKLASGFRIKTANPAALIPDSEDVSRPAAVGSLGGDLVAQVEKDGTTTINTQPAVKDTLEDITIKVVDEFGLYKVRRKGEGQDLVGWVFPTVMALDGTVLPMAVFSNGSESAVQENIAGVSVGKNTDLLDAEPTGTGCFYHATNTGAVALVPVIVRSKVESPEGASYVCETVLGEKCSIVKTSGLKEVSVIGEGRYGIPEDMGFMPLNSPVELSSSPDEFTKTAEAKLMPAAVRVITDGTCYTFEGESIDKLAGVMETSFLGKDDAVFLGAILGQEPTKLASMLGTMRSGGRQEVWFEAGPVTPYKEKFASARKAAEATLNKLPSLRTGLFKVAAPLEDPTAVDKILSVGFINPENLSIFASYVPEFEDVIGKLSELLMAARFGLQSVDEGAIQKALVHLDKVVAGLKTLGDTAQA